MVLNSIVLKILNVFALVKSRNGVDRYSHAALMAAIVSPDSKNVIPLKPEFIVKQENSDKEDCENSAFKRWFAKNLETYQDLNMTIIAYSLYSKAPICELLDENNTKFIFVCKESGNKTIFEYVTNDDLTIVKKLVRNNYTNYTHIYSYQNQVPLTAALDPF